MDWRDLIDERNRREQARRQASLFASSPSTTQPLPQREEDDGGFFGGIGKAVGGVANFFGNMVKDTLETGEEALKTVRDVVVSPIKTMQANQLNEEANKILKENGQATKDWTDADWNDPVKKAEVQARIDRAKEILSRAQSITASDTIKDRDALKSAAATAETFLNVATLGGGTLLKSGGKQAVKQGVKEVAKEGAESLAKTAAKKIGKNAAEGALIGAGYGVLQPIKNEGSEATSEDIFRSALFGGALGGVAGGGATLLDKNVRAGVREMPGLAKGKFDDQLAAYRALPESVKQGGYIRVPGAGAADDVPLSQLGGKRPDNELQKALEDAWNGGDLAGAQKIIDQLSPDLKAPMQGLQDYRVKTASGGIDKATAGAETARRQLMGEDVRPLSGVDQEAEQTAQSIAASYKSADDYIADSARTALNQEKGKLGGQLIDRSGPNQPYGSEMTRISEHAPWYSDYYAANGRAPSLQATKDIIEEGLRTGKGVNGLVYPEESRIYQLLKDREAGFARTMEEGPQDFAQQFTDDLMGAPAKTPRSTGPKMPAGLPKGPQPGQTALNDAMGQVPRYDTSDDLQRALGRMEADSNPAIDYIDPLKRGGVKPTEQPTLPGTKPEPYAGFEQDLTRPALPAGEVKVATPKEAKARFKKDGEIVDFANRIDPGKEPIALLPTSEESAKVAVRQTKGGKLKPLATNNAHITKDDVAAIRAIAEDDTSSAFTMTRTPDLNLEEAFRKRGGTNSKEFKVLSKFNTSIREHTAELTREIDRRRDFLNRFVSEYGVNGKSATAMRPYLEAKTDEASKAALEAFKKEFGDKATEGLVRLRKWWRAEKDVVRNETNAVIERYAGKDRMMGDLGESYVPRVYRSGKAGFKDSVLDVVHAGLDKIGGKNGMFNLSNSGGYLSKETETMGGVLRNAEGIPLNSEIAKPNTTFLSAAQKRTAKSPIKDLEDPLTSMMRYFEATGRAKYMTEDIARGRTMQKAIEMVNNESGNLRQMYKAYEDQINAVAGKTARIDRPFVDSASGAKFVNVATKLQSRVARSTILGSAQSAFAQTGQMPLIAAENGANNFRKGMLDMFRMLRSKGDDPMAESALMTTRYPKFEEIFTVKKSTKAANKFTNVVAKPFRLIEHASSELAWRSSYNRAVADGLTGKEAIQAADRITAKIIGERSPGARAALYESKALGPVTSYTLEVNQLYQVAKQYFKRDPKKAAKLVAAIWLYNQGYSAVTGNKLNADPLQATLDAGNILTSDEYLDENGQPIGMGERLVRAGGRLAGEAIDATPLGGPVVGQLYPEQGFRVPFAGGERTLRREEIFGDTNFGRYGGGTPIASGISNPLLLLGIPGAAQFQRSVEGLGAYDQGASVTPGGETRFQIDPTTENWWRALLFGMYGTEEGRQYLADQNARLAGQSVQGALRF